MKDSELYYTPSIEEFHVGYEYETYDGMEWLKGEITLWTDLKNLFDCEDKCPIPARVKYLDEEDILSLGWKKKDEWYELPTKNNTEKRGYLLNTDKYYLIKSGNATIIEFATVHDLLVKPSDLSKSIDTAFLFQGFIKNKSELKKIMEQIGVTVNNQPIVNSGA